jgi:hypothetical protein
MISYASLQEDNITEQVFISLPGSPQTTIFFLKKTLFA